jgi:hypothetical protein
MSDYFVTGTQTVAGTTDTTLTLERGSARYRVYDFSSGFTLASPSDNLLTVTADRFGTTNDGTGDAETPAPLDTADAAAGTTCLVNHSAEPSSYLTTEVFKIAQHMRATYRWVAAPGKEIVMPDTANTGVGFFADHASVTPEHVMGVYFSE